MLVASILILAAVTLGSGYFRLLDPTRLNVISVMLGSHLVIQVASAFGFYFSGHYPAAERFLMASCVAALLIPVGGLLADILVLDARPRLQRFYARIQKPPQYCRVRLKLFAKVLFSVGALLTAVYVLTVPGWPLGELLFGADNGHGQFMEARRAASVAGLGYPFAAAKMFLMPFAVGFAVAWWSMSRHFGSVPKRTLALLILTALIFNSFSGATTGVAMLAVVGVLVGWHCLVQERLTRRLPRRRLWAFAGVGLLLVLSYPVFLGLVKPIGDLGLWYILKEEIILRITTKPALNAYYAFEIFPGKLAYTWFADISDIARLTGREFINTGTLVSVYKGQGAFNQAPPPTLGTFHAQGGWPVITAGYLLAAILFRLMETVIVRSRYKTPVEVAVHALLLYGAFRLAWSKFHYILWTETLVPAALILIAWKLCRIHVSRQSAALVQPAR